MSLSDGFRIVLQTPTEILHFTEVIIFQNSRNKQPSAQVEDILLFLGQRYDGSAVRVVVGCEGIPR